MTDVKRNLLMATIFTHPVIAVGLSPWLDFQEKRKQIIFFAIILTILPDVDVIGFRSEEHTSELQSH